MIAPALSWGAPRTAALSRLLPALGFVGVAALVALPILAHPFLPLVDLPNHMARHHIAASESAHLARYWDYELALTPNAAVDLAFLLLGGALDPLRFSQVVLAAYAVALVASAMLLFRVVWGRWSVWPLAAGLLAYNANFLWGFQNYVVSVPAAVAGLALWLATERRPTWQRLLILTPLGAGLYVLHFFAFAFLGLAALGREAQRLLTEGGSWGGRLARGLPMALPFVLPVAWLAVETLTSGPSPAGSFTQGASWLERVQALTSVAFGPAGTGSPALRLTAGLTLAAVVTFAALLMLPGAARPRLAPVLVGPAIAVAAGALLAPSWLNGVALVHIRLPFALAILLVAGSRWEGLRPGVAAAMTAAVLALLVARGWAFENEAARHSAEMRDLSAALERLPQGARLLPLAKEPAPGNWHAQAYAVLQRDAFVPTLFQGVHNLTVRPEWRSSASALWQAVPVEDAFAALELEEMWYRRRFDHRVEFLEGWPTKFTHVLVTGPADGSAVAMPDWLHPLARQGRFALYEIRAEDAPLPAG